MTLSSGTMSWLQKRKFTSAWEALDMAWKKFPHGECVKEWFRVKLIKILLGISVSTKKDFEILKAWHLDTA